MLASAGAALAGTGALASAPHAAAAAAATGSGGSEASASAAFSAAAPSWARALAEDVARQSRLGGQIAFAPGGGGGAMQAGHLRDRGPGR
jgi:hypothetical protein